MRFFFDNNISRRLAEAMAALSTYEDSSIQVHHLQGRFGPKVSDIQWIGTLAAEGDWVVVSGDGRIRTRPAEKRAFQSAGLTTFFWAKGWLKSRFWDQAALLVRWWPHVIQQSRLVQPGAVFEIPHRKPGKFRQL